MAYLRLLAFYVYKTDAAREKKCHFSMPALTHSAWQQTQVGTGLGGQLPFAGPAKAPSAHTLQAILPTRVLI